MSDTVNLRSPDRATLSASGFTLTCSSQESSLAIGSGQNDIVVTPSSATCVPASSGGGGAIGPPVASSGPATPAIPIPSMPVVTPITPVIFTPAIKDIPSIKGVFEVREVAVPTNGEMTTRTNLVNATGDVSIDLLKNVKLTGL